LHPNSRTVEMGKLPILYAKLMRANLKLSIDCGLFPQLPND